MFDQSGRHAEPPGDPAWPEESRIRGLLEEILDTGKDPERVSGGDLRLERVLRQRLRRARDVEAQMEAMFPSPHGSAVSARRALRDFGRERGRLPEIPGYTISHVIGTGGMGVVYRARHLRLDRWVAIKMLLLGAYASGEEMRCLLREAQDVAALRHPNIVQVYDVAEHDGFPYFAMELLEGGDLARTLQGKPLAAREAADLIRILAGAVHAAHVGGIVHRDLKPGNIFLTSDGSPKIGDFSLARRFRHESTIMTHARQVGTPSYMAPEQALGEPGAICPAVDIYSLGAILYELLTGRPPFQAESSEATRRQVITEEPVPPLRLNSRVPRDLQTICLKCLQKDPARRYVTADDLAADINRFTSGEPVLARPVGAPERMVKWCLRRPSTTVAVAVSVLAVAGAVAGGIWLQNLEHARHTQESVRRERARAAIEAALPSLSEFVRIQQWADATGVLRTAQAQLGDAQSPEMERQVAAAEEWFEIAEELDRIRQRFLAPEYAGAVYFPAREAYAHVFRRVAIGPEVDASAAAARIRESPLSEQLLIALDHAAYIEFLTGEADEVSRLLSLGRSAGPDPWQDRFRDPATWRDLGSLQALVDDAAGAEPAPPSHQMVLVGLLLGTLDAHAARIAVLREAQLRDPSDFSLNLWLGRTLRSVGDHAEALQFLRAAAALNPGHAVTWTEIGRTLLDAGLYEDAIGPLRKATAADPKFSPGWANLFMAFVGCQRWADAVATERDAVSAIPTFSLGGSEDTLQICQGRAAIETMDWPVAAEAYAKIFDGDGRYLDNADLWFEFAATTLLAGGVPAYGKVCASMLGRQGALGLRGRLVARACTIGTVGVRDLARAAELGTADLDQTDESHLSLTRRAALLCRAGRAGEAIPILERSLQLSTQPEEAIPIWTWLSRAHLSLGERDAAKIWLGMSAAWLDRTDTQPEDMHRHDWLEAHILRLECERELAR